MDDILAQTAQQDDDEGVGRPLGYCGTRTVETKSTPTWTLLLEVHGEAEDTTTLSNAKSV